MLALGPQDYILVSGPQDSAVGLDHGRCQIRLHGTHLHRAAASSKYVTYATVPEGWEQCRPVHVGMCPCDTVSTVGEEAAGEPSLKEMVNTRVTGSSCGLTFLEHFQQDIYVLFIPKYSSPQRLFVPTEDAV